jgi:enterochelin esterase family protein
LENITVPETLASDHSPQSPRLVALKERLDAGDDAALDAFWQEIETTGTPLIEPHPDRHDARLVTFLWKETEPVDRVLLVNFFRGFKLGDDETFTRLGDSNLLYLTDAMRSDMRSTYSLAPDGTVGQLTFENVDERSKEWLPDPLNRQNLQLFPAEPGQDPEVMSPLELPDAPPQPWLEPQPGIATGEVTSHRFASSILGNERDVFVYTPAGFSHDGEPSALLVHFDAQWRDLPMQVPATLDKLIAAGAIAPVVAVFLDNVDRWNELPCNADFARAVATELIPWVREQFHAGLTPDVVVAAGQSYGGLASLWLALQHPDAVGNVLSQSGSFWWGPDFVEIEKSMVLGDAPRFGWLIDEVARRPAVPVRIWMEAGAMELVISPRGYIPTLFGANRHMEQVLRLKGYDVHFREYAGAHDFVTWRGSLPDGLIHLLGA